MEIFGLQEENKPYRHRDGAYCVLFDKANRIAAVEVSGYLLLPGGGIESGEDPLTALEREFAEETGLAPKNLQYICQTGEYMRSLDGKHCEYVLANLFWAAEYKVLGAPIEEDHILKWLDPQAAISTLFRPGQQWAVAEALRRRTL